MNSHFRLACVAGFLLAVSGCGASADSLITEQIKLMDELSTAWEANAPPERIAAIQAKQDTLNARMQRLNLSEDDRRRLGLRHKAELERAASRLQAASRGKDAGE